MEKRLGMSLIFSLVSEYTGFPHQHGLTLAFNRKRSCLK